MPNESPIETPAPPPGVLVADHFVHGLGYQAYRRHGTRDWLITYTRDGVGCYQIGERRYECRAGDIVVLPPGVTHHYETATAEAAWDFYWAHFLPHVDWLAWLKFDEALPGVFAQRIDDDTVRQRIEQAFVKLVRDNNAMLDTNKANNANRASALRKALAENALEEVLLLTAQQRASAHLMQTDPRVTIVLNYIADHMHETLNIATLARLVDLSSSRLSHVFKIQTGTSIIETVLAMRLRRAARLLQFSALNVQQIADETGFQSPFYFSRLFKIYYGSSPSHFRDRTSDTGTDTDQHGSTRN